MLETIRAGRCTQDALKPMISVEFIRNEVNEESYELSIHADDERLNDGLGIDEIEFALIHGNIIEKYPDDARGESCLVCGDPPEKIPLHIVCGKNSLNHLFVITIYIPKMPKWLTPYIRNR